MGNAKTTNPKWWTDKNDSAWNKVKDAFARDWEQTKADFSKTQGHELNQNVSDTVKQAAGKESIPPANVPNTSNKSASAQGKSDYASAEPALRYGYGAASQFGAHESWDNELETKLSSDWHSIGSGREWNDVKTTVRSGWERARKH